LVSVCVCVCVRSHFGSSLLVQALSAKAQPAGHLGEKGGGHTHAGPALRRLPAHHMATKGRSRKHAGAPAAPAADDVARRDDVCLSSLAASGAKASRRSTGGVRFAEDRPLVREAVLGYVAGEPDPAQSGDVKTESSEIARLKKVKGIDKFPIAKDARVGYVWVALAKPLVDDDFGRDRYTADVAEMQVCSSDIGRTCDICGRNIKDGHDLYMFRCYEKRPPGSDLAGEDLRRLHPCKAFLGKDCGKGLLGRRSDQSKVLESFEKVLMQPDADEQLQALYARSSRKIQLLIEEQLRLYSQRGGGGDRRIQELKDAERRVGCKLHKAEDPFRAVARSLPTISGQDLAALAYGPYALEAKQSAGSFGSYSSAVVEALRQRRTLPAAPQRLLRDQALEVLAHIAEALRVKISLKTALENEDKAPASVGSGDVEIILFYSIGFNQLHALDQPPPLGAEALKDGLQEELMHVRRAFSDIHLGVVVTHRTGGGCKLQDKLVAVPAGGVSPEFVYTTLAALSWPLCFSRKNVMPDKSVPIEAFAIGVVMVYGRGLMTSRTLRTYPNITKVLVKLIQSCPEAQAERFKYTTLQLNRNYPAKLHVDRNNHGPSYIIGLGNYTGGELWIMDQHDPFGEPGPGDFQLTVEEPLRGWPELTAPENKGRLVKGKISNINGTWKRFDGTVPHRVLPFKGSRISIVYFTRSKYMTMKQEDRDRLANEFGFPLPGEEWEKMAGVKREFQKAGAGGSKVGTSGNKRQRVEEIAPEDEVDEDEMMDAQLNIVENGIVWHAADWSTLFLTTLGLAPLGSCAAVGRKIRLVTSCAGLAPVVALQQLLPKGRLQVLAMCEAGFERQRCLKALAKTFCEPELLYASASGTTDAKPLCEVKNRVAVMAGDGAHDIFVGAFAAKPFRCRGFDFATRASSKGNKYTYESDDRAEPFWAHRKHLQARRPAVVLLVATDTWDMPPAELRGVLGLLMTSREPCVSRGGQPCGLEALEGYASDLCEVSFRDYGTPLSHGCVLIVLVREDCGGQAAASRAVQLTRLLGKLPFTRAEQMMFSDDDPRLNKIRQEEWSKVADQPQHRKLGKDLEQEARRLQDSAWSYGRARAAEDAAWFSYGLEFDRKHASIAHQRAYRDGLDVDNLVVNLRHGAVADEGLLPDPSLACGWNYSFAHHRPILGIEELLMRGFPVSTMGKHKRFTCISDVELLNLAWHALPVPAMGAALLAALLSVDLRGEGFWRPEEVARLAAPVELPKDVVSREWLRQAQQPLQDEGVQSVSMRATALMNMLRHSKFLGDTEGRKELAGPTKKLSQTLEVLGQQSPHVIADEALPMACGQELTIKHSYSEVEFASLVFREERLQKGNKYKPPSLEVTLRWICDATEMDPEDTRYNKAMNIAGLGLDHMLSAIQKESHEIPDVLVQHRDELYNNLDAAGWAVCLSSEHQTPALAKVHQSAAALFGHIDRAILRKALAVPTSPVSLTYAYERGSWKHHEGVLKSVGRAWPLKLEYLNYILKLIQSTTTSNDMIKTFLVNGGGAAEIARWLFGVPKISGEKLTQEHATLVGTKKKEAADAVHLEGLYRLATFPGLGRPEKLLLTAAVHHLTYQADVPDKESKKKTSAVAKWALEQLVKAAKEAIQQFMANPQADSGALEAIRLLAREPVHGPVRERFEGTYTLLMSCAEVIKSLSMGDMVSVENLGELEGSMAQAKEVASSMTHACGWSKEPVMEMLHKAEEACWKEFRDRVAPLREEAAHRENKQRAIERQAWQREIERQVRQVDRSLADVKQLLVGRRLKVEPGAPDHVFKQQMRKLHEKLVPVRVLLIQQNPSLFERLDLGEMVTRLLFEGGDGAAILEKSGAKDVLLAADAASTTYRMLPARRNRALAWLRDTGFSACFPLLEAWRPDVLMGLHQLRTEGAEVLRHSGLPERCVAGLIQAAVSQDLRDSDLEPGIASAPPGWQQLVAEHSGLRYFASLKPGVDFQWKWPVMDPYVPSPLPELFLVPLPQFNCEPQKGMAVYMEVGDPHDVVCRLCISRGVCGSSCTGFQHLETNSHKRARRVWDDLIDRLWSCARELQQQVDPARVSEAVPGLSLVWHYELLRRLQTPGGVFGIFWHRIVVPRRQAFLRTSSAEQILKELASMAVAARFPEPAREIIVPAKRARHG